MGVHCAVLSAFLYILKSSQCWGKIRACILFAFNGFFCFIIHFYCILQKYQKGINQEGNFKIFNKTRKQCLKT